MLLHAFLWEELDACVCLLHFFFFFMLVLWKRNSRSYVLSAKLLVTCATKYFSLNDLLCVCVLRQLKKKL